MDNTFIKLVGSFYRRWKKYWASSTEQSHAYRYMHFIENSDLKEECRYAKASLKVWETSQIEKEMIELYKLQEELRVIILFYETQIRKDSKL